MHFIKDIVSIFLIKIILTNKKSLTYINIKNCNKIEIVVFIKGY